MSGCGCNSRKTKEESEMKSAEHESNDVCSMGKEEYSAKGSGIYNALISIGAGVGGYYLTSGLNVESSYSKTGIVLLSIIIGNVLSMRMKIGNRIAGMMFDRKCGDE